MGGVIIESFNAQLGAGAGMVNQFSLWTDEFGEDVPPRTIGDVRTDYAFIIHGANANPCDNAPSISPVNGGLRFTGNGSAQVIFANWVPVKAPLVWGVSQFVEATISLNAANSAYRGGFGLLNSGDHRGGAGGFNANYELNYAADLPSLVIQQTLNNVVTTLTSVAAVPANGSKVAFAADFQATPGSVRLTAWDDEVLILDVTDATPNTTGLPSVMTRNCVLGLFMDIRHLRIGTLDHLEYYV